MSRKAFFFSVLRLSFPSSGKSGDASDCAESDKPAELKSYDSAIPQFIKKLSPWHNFYAILCRLGIVFVAYEDVP